MILKRIYIENIRSYKKEEIFFPSGSLMISGDIGSGKTSLLLAIEFALFGIVKGSITGEALLRHGSNVGIVELDFSVNGKDITIRRILKRQNTVRQDNGFMVINEIKYELSPIELKARVLDILGYPKTLIAKNRELLYRYTIFTAQEQMKQIILERPDERLKILRKLFGIDKYERIKENSTLLMRNINTESRILLEQLKDLPQREEELNKIQEHIKDARLIAEKAVEEFDRINQKLINKTAEITKLEQELLAHKQILLELTAKKKELEQKTYEKEEKRGELTQNNEELSKLPREEDLKELVKKDLNTIIVNIETEISIVDSDIKESLREIATIDSQIENSKKLLENILKLNICPVCKQQVSQEHKQKIRKKETEHISLLKIRKDEIEDSLKQKNDMKEKLRKRLESLRVELQKQAVAKQQLSNIQKIKERHEYINKKLEDTEKIISQLEQEIKELSKKVEEFKKSEQILDNLKKEYKEILNKQRSALENKSKAVRDLEILKAKEIELKNLVSTRKSKKKYAEKLSGIASWLRDFYQPLIDLIEQKVMTKLQAEFNSFFSDWFTKLIDGLEATIDSRFTPVIKHQGFEIDFNALSGGERTAVALAYRLALNTIVNKVAGNIKTRGLLILDEPTEGFSTEQLDKVRNVLQDLNLKQLIIVSHEPKVESFVDTVLKVEKIEGVSRILKQ